jgi:nucleotide-binding universal stress UspA family protein
MRTILVGVDGSQGAQRALDWALEEARRHSGMVEVVHVSPHMAIPTYVAGRAGGEPGPTKEQRMQSGEQLLDEMIAAAAPAEGVSVEREVVLADNPSAALVERSSKADLLVVGSRGLGGFRGLLLGSVSQQCVTHAACPVVVIPPPRA